VEKVGGDTLRRRGFETVFVPEELSRNPSKKISNRDRKSNKKVRGSSRENCQLGGQLREGAQVKG